MQQYDMPLVEAVPYLLYGCGAMMVVILIGFALFKWCIRDREK